MHRRLQLLDLHDQPRHFINSIHSLFRVGGVGSLSKSFHQNLSPAALAAFNIQIGSLSDDHVIRFHYIAYTSCGNTLKAFLMNHTGNINLPGKIPSVILPETGCCHRKCGYRPLHIRCASSIQLTILHHRPKRRMMPCLPVFCGNRIKMSVKKNLRAFLISGYFSDHISVFVRTDIIKIVISHIFCQNFRCGILITGIAFCSHQKTAQFQNLSAVFIHSHYLAFTYMNAGSMYGRT